MKINILILSCIMIISFSGCFLDPVQTVNTDGTISTSYKAEPIVNKTTEIIRTVSPALPEPIGIIGLGLSGLLSVLSGVFVVAAKNRGDAVKTLVHGIEYTTRSLNTIEGSVMEIINGIIKDEATLNRIKERFSLLQDLKKNLSKQNNSVINSTVKKIT